MFILLPVGATIRALPVIVLMVLLFAAGCFLGTTAVWVFTASILLEKIHLWAIPVSLLSGLVLCGLARQAFKAGDSGDSEPGFFATPGRSAAVVLVLALLALAGGSWLGVFAAEDERQFRLTQAHNREPTARGARMATVGTNVVAGRAAIQSFRLQGIFFNSTKPSAIIGGQTIFVGDNLSGWRVKAIEPKQVTLEHADGQVRTLELK
jgi:hypothetical protein